MDITQFSTFLAFLAVATIAAGIILVISMCFKNTRGAILSQDYFLFIQLIAGLALFSTISVLIYQIIYETPVCILCWWQRIWMFPIEIVTLVALWYRVRIVHLMTGISALFGLSFASYHYYYHFQAFVLGRTVSLPCDQGGLLPACTESPILIFGFITIPFMAVVAFAALLVLSIIAHIKFLKESSRVV